MCAGGTPYRLEIASVSASALLSGYQLTSAAAAVMAFATEGSGPYGLSFEASLNDWPAALATRRPGLYGANWFRTERKRGDRSDTVVLRLSGRATSLAVCHRPRVQARPVRTARKVASMSSLNRTKRASSSWLGVRLAVLNAIRAAFSAGHP